MSLRHIGKKVSQPPSSLGPNLKDKVDALKPSPKMLQKGQHAGAIYCAYCQFAAGAIGGGTATYSTHWLDTVRVKMQAFPQLYNSGYGCLVDTIKHEGVKGLYQGATPAVIGHTCKAAIVFACFGMCEELVKKIAGIQRTENLHIYHHASAGAMTGVMASFVLCPLEVIKCRLQALAQTGAIKADTSRCMPGQLVKNMVRSEGLSGFYRGLTAMWVKEIPGSFIYFGSYEAAKSVVRQLTEKEHLDSKAVFICGMFAGLCFCTTHPIETVKTRVQIMTSTESIGFLRAAQNIIRTEGLAPLYSGLRPSMLRAGMYSGIQFVTYEAMKEYMLREPN